MGVDTKRFVSTFATGLGVRVVSKTEDLDRKLIVNDFTGKERLYSNFRTLYDAPEWTKDEVKCIDRIVREEGMKKVRA
jgi:hypothetical protein